MDFLIRLNEYNPAIEGNLGEATIAILALLAVFYIAILIMLVVFSIVTLVSMWRMFAKAGISGWLCLVPIYNVYVMYKNFWNVGAFKRLIAWAVISGILSGAMQLIPMGDALYTTLYIVNVAVSLLSVFNMFILNYRLAKSFDRGFLFALGLSFLSPFFYWILGLGDCDYVGDAYDYYY